MTRGAHVLRSVAHVFGIPEGGISGRCRAAKTVEARAAVAGILRDQLGRGSSKVAAHLLRRDESTARHEARLAARLAASDPDFRLRYLLAQTKATRP